MNNHKNQSLLRRFGFALAGLLHGVRTERSVRLELVLFALVVAALVLLRPGPIWWAAVMLASAGVLGAELLNTAIETLADHLSPGIHPQIRIVKDCAAAAVFVNVVGAIAVAIALAVHLLRR
ncbi:MAG TPA: diacylglycerol kinase [Steroidobacteraceae bacterium]|nr:diacylglycerol kinase [Steroidobacteraceae bacterium]